VRRAPVAVLAWASSRVAASRAWPLSSRAMAEAYSGVEPAVVATLAQPAASSMARPGASQRRRWDGDFSGTWFGISIRWAGGGF